MLREMNSTKPDCRKIYQNVNLSSNWSHSWCHPQTPFSQEKADWLTWVGKLKQNNSEREQLDKMSYFLSKKIYFHKK